MAHSFSDGDWPDPGDVPARALPVIRYLYEIDVMIAAIIQRSIVPQLPAAQATKTASAITAATARVVAATGVEHTPVPAEHLGRAISALADYDDVPWCGTGTGHWPPRPHRLDGAGDPQPQPWRTAGLAEVSAAVITALRLVDTAGSKELQAELAPVLKQTLTALAR